MLTLWTMSKTVKNVHQFQFWKGQKTHSWHLQWLWTSVLQLWSTLVSKSQKLTTVKWRWLLWQKKWWLSWLKSKLTLWKPHTKKMLKKAVKFQKQLTFHTWQFVLTSHWLKLCEFSQQHHWHQFHLSLTMSLRVTKLVKKLFSKCVKHWWVHESTWVSSNLFMTSKKSKTTCVLSNSGEFQ